ncbi:SHK1 binding protein 1 isoform 1 [Hibiscus syriacus]|uniref:SHK1 binding protein 1 isoform 1 n=1 Tax=Hibiscus syriacus TaxID=106335 RepID=A0A6A2XXY7_HIBSY|nr:SHK1 binding protein 1 isoform 1 [Hibiscus syriacus]
MAVTIRKAALVVAGLGVLSFVFGVIAENKKPVAGTPIPGKDVVVCKYPSDPSVALGYMSVSFLILSYIAGYWSLFYPYRGKSVPQSVLFQSTAFFVFFSIAL